MSIGWEGVVPILSISASVWLGMGAKERPEVGSSASSHPAASAAAASARLSANSRFRQEFNVVASPLVSLCLADRRQKVHAAD
jgi:hypothetical protein